MTSLAVKSRIYLAVKSLIYLAVKSLTYLAVKSLISLLCHREHNVISARRPVVCLSRNGPLCNVKFVVCDVKCEVCSVKFAVWCAV